MVSSTGIPAIGSTWTDWRLLFASQPEPDLEFTDDDLNEAVPPPAPPMNSPKRSKKGPLFWMLLLLLLGGIGYVAMDPDAAMQLIQPYLDGGAEPAQPVARRPPAPAPKPVAPPAPAPAPSVAPPAVVDSAPPPSVESPAAMPMPTPAPAATVQAPTPAASVPTAAPAEAPVPARAPAALAPAPARASKPAPAPVRVPGPLYAERQRVMVIADPSRPKSPLPLFADAVGSKTSTTVPASTTLTILDGEYQKNGWVYSVRTQDGRKGWIPDSVIPFNVLVDAAGKVYRYDVRSDDLLRYAEKLAK